jgi:hypothetical protein
MSQALAGINEKLKRSHENIGNLQEEISAFFTGCKYPTIPNIDEEGHLDAVEFHSKLPIPPRLSVLTGEIVHHLRSCFDHIVWALSRPTYRASVNGKYIEFPVLDVRPTKEAKFSRYERKINGISSTRSLRLIEDLQPYNGLYPRTAALWIIHNMDRIDKHRELIIVGNVGNVELPTAELAAKFAHSIRKESPGFTPELREQLKKYGKITPHVVFRNFGGRKHQPVVPGLQDLLDFTRDVVGLFESDLLNC